MKIDNNITSPHALPVNDNRQAKAEGKPSGGDIGSGVIISGSMSSVLNALNTNTGTAADVDRVRINEIKQAIASGNISVNPSNIADGLLDAVVKMFGSGK